MQRMTGTENQKRAADGVNYVREVASRHLLPVRFALVNRSGNHVAELGQAPAEG